MLLQGYSALCALLLLASAEEKKETKAVNEQATASEPVGKRQDKRGLEHDFGGFEGGGHFEGLILNIFFPFILEIKNTNIMFCEKN